LHEPEHGGVEEGGWGGLTREETVLKMVDDLQGKLPPDLVGQTVKVAIFDGTVGATAEEQDGEEHHSWRRARPTAPP
jgi:hypothetical protein